MMTTSAYDAGERDDDSCDNYSDNGISGPSSTLDEYLENGQEGDGREDDEDPYPIIQMSIVDPASETETIMSTEEQCNLTMDMAQEDPDAHVYLFRNALAKIMRAVDERMRRKRLLGQYISRDRMALYEAEFDMWHSYMVRVLKSCQGSWMQRIHSVMYIVGYCILVGWAYATKRLTETLVDLYKDDAWNESVSDGLEFGMPKGYEDDYILFNTVDDPPPVSVPDRISLCLTVLEKTGSDPRLVLKDHWMTDDCICTRYLQYLMRHGCGSEAGRVASVGLELFPRSVRVAAAVLGALDPTSEGALRARCVMYAADPDSEHYEAAKASPRWDARWARRLADMLAVCGEHGAEILVRSEACMRAEALDVLRYDGTLRMAISHRRTFAASDPDEYYKVCRALVIDAPKRGADKVQHAMILQCLRIMKAIPGYESDFEETCESLMRDEHAVPAKLRKSIQKVVEQ